MNKKKILLHATLMLSMVTMATASGMSTAEETAAQEGAVLSNVASELGGLLLGGTPKQPKTTSPKKRTKKTKKMGASASTYTPAYLPQPDVPSNSSAPGSILMGGGGSTDTPLYLPQGDAAPSATETMRSPIGAPKYRV